MPRLSISLGDFEKCMSPRAIDSVGKYIVRNLFLEIQFRESNLTTLWKFQKFTLTHFWQKFRESNGFTKEITT